MSVARLRPDARARLDDLLRSCVQCGLCLPHCATYLATGNEAQSPRGRLLLLAELLAAPDARPAPAALQAFDQCLGCLACVSACPSGISADLLEAAKARAHAARRGAGTGALARALARPGVLAALRLPAAVARVMTGRARHSRFVRLAGSVPQSPDDPGLTRLLDELSRRAGREPAPPAPATAAAPSGPRVALFAGCASAALLSASQRRLRALLAAAGCDVVTPAGQACCGALAAHLGQSAQAAALRTVNVACFAEIEAEAIVVEAAGCGRELGSYPVPFAARVRDAALLLAGLTLPAARELPLRVVYHDPCHARHGQGLVAPPRALLARVPGLTIVEPEEAAVCCGSGGPYALLHPDLAGRMGRRKAAHLAATGADLIVTGNPGCLGHLQAALRECAPALPALPLTDLLWYACLAGRA